MRELTAARRREVYDLSNKHCHICGDRVEFDDCQIDHIWPVELGGSDDTNNLLPAHSVCNHLKWHNDPQTIQRMLFLGMLANFHGYIKLTEFGKRVREERAARLWQGGAREAGGARRGARRAKCGRREGVDRRRRSTRELACW